MSTANSPPPSQRDGRRLSGLLAALGRPLLLFALVENGLAARE